MQKFAINPHFQNYAFTTTHFWYSSGHALQRRNLETNVDERVHRFPQCIRDLKANNDGCVVATGYANKRTLWVKKATWESFTKNVKRWHLVPGRVVYEDRETCIWSYNFSTTSFVAKGLLMGASGQRVLYEDGGPKWQDGKSADGVFTLLENDVAVLDGEPRSWPSAVYRIIDNNNLYWIKCRSRCDIRLRRLLGNEVASQLLTHA